MAVNPNKSGMRMLAVLEQIAHSKPIGVRELSRLMNIEKSAVQRAVATLSEAGWIQPSSSSEGAGWELGSRILLISHLAHGSNTFRQRARPAMEALRDATKETTFLATPTTDGLVVIDVAESREPLRTVVPLGVPTQDTDTVLIDAVLPFLPRKEREHLVGEVPEERLRMAAAQVAEKGYCIGETAPDANSLSLAIAILGLNGEAIGALCVRAVKARTGSKQQEAIGRLLLQKQQELSLAARNEISAADLRKSIGRFG